MNSSLYIIECTLLLLLFHTVFALSYKHIAGFKAQRWFILAAVLLSVMFPFLPSMLHSPSFAFEVLLPQVTIGGTGKSVNAIQNAPQGFPSIVLVYAVYFAVASLILIRTIVSLTNITSLIKNGERKTIGDQTVIFSDKISSPCSFFNFVFIPSTITDKQELETCIQHEIIHSHLRHSIDKIILQLSKAVLWWHPSVYYFSRQMELVHEYQVDQRMTNAISKETYQKVLLKFLLYPTGLRIANPFSSNIKKRIIMMNRFEIKNNPAKTIAAILLLFFGVIFIHACTEDQALAEENSSMKTAEKQDSQPESYELEVKDTIVTFNADTFEETIQIVSGKKKIFNTVDQMPIFPGCEDGLEGEALSQCSNQKLLGFIYNNVKYPKAAAEKGVEGTVLVKFVVNKDGYIDNREFLKTLGDGIEETVNDMLDKMQYEIKWIPGVHDGKEVNVAYTLPVKFKLEG